MLLWCGLLYRKRGLTRDLARTFLGKALQERGTLHLCPNGNTQIVCYGRFIPASDQNISLSEMLKKHATFMGRVFHKNEVSRAWTNLKAQIEQCPGQLKAIFYNRLTAFIEPLFVLNSRFSH